MIYKVKCVCDKCNSEYEFTTDQHSDVYEDDEETKFSTINATICENCGQLINEHIIQVTTDPEI